MKYHDDTHEMNAHICDTYQESLFSERFPGLVEEWHDDNLFAADKVQFDFDNEYMNFLLCEIFSIILENICD